MNQPFVLPATRSRIPRRNKVIIALAVLPGVLVAALVMLRVCGVLRPYNVPTSAMSPAARPGDHILAEGLSYRFGKVKRGDIIAFETDHIPGATRTGPPTIFLKRVAGLPGERVRIESGKLYINDAAVALTNCAGGIHHANVGNFSSPAYTATVPARHYFVLGDTSTNSFDSRFWGFVPRDAILGRAFFRYAPLSRWGRVQ